MRRKSKNRERRKRRATRRAPRGTREQKMMMGREANSVSQKMRSNCLRVKMPWRTSLREELRRLCTKEPGMRLKKGTSLCESLMLQRHSLYILGKLEKLEIYGILSLKAHL